MVFGGLAPIKICTCSYCEYYDDDATQVSECLNEESPLYGLRDYVARGGKEIRATIKDSQMLSSEQMIDGCKYFDFPERLSFPVEKISRKILENMSSTSPLRTHPRLKGFLEEELDINCLPVGTPKEMIEVFVEENC